MNNVRKQMAAASLSLCVMAASGQVHADDLSIYLPERYSGDLETPNSSLWRVFAEGALPGVTLNIWNGTQNKRVAHIAVPDDRRYGVLKRRMRKFAAETAKIAAFTASLKDGGSAGEDRIDLLSVLRAIGENRLDRDQPLHVMIAGSPVQILREPSWSMVGEDGSLQFPSDGAIRAADLQSPYGTSGRKDHLRNAFVHMCVTDGARRNSFENAALRRVWSHWTGLQGGALVTWAEDISVCFERFQAGVKEPVEVVRLTDTASIGMVRSARQADESAKTAKREQPEAFNLFYKMNHPSIEGLIVFTGVEYVPADYPRRYVTSWCYFNSASNRDGIQVRIGVGDKTPGSSPNWHDVSDAQLNAAGVSRANFETSKSACRFPQD